MNTHFAHALIPNFHGSPAPPARRQRVPRLALCLTGLLAGALAQGWGANLALNGTGLLGVNDAVDGDAGIVRVNSGVVRNIVDGDPGTRVDTYYGGGGVNNGPVSFVGVKWLTPRYEQVENLVLTLATFTDGGWFGTNGSNPGPGGTLTAADLLEPTVQVSTNGGVNWTTVAHTSDYLIVMEGHGIGGGGNDNPTVATVTFTFTTPVTAITGIRIIGQNGGIADGNGFLGVFELEVNAPDPTDSDGDGMPDAWEQAYGLNVAVNDSDGNPDGDFLTNLEEYTGGTNPQAADTDGNGFNDGLVATGIMGTKPDLESGTETEVTVLNAGTAQNIIDGDLATRVDTWNNLSAGTVSFVGMTWNQPLPLGNTVSSIDLTFATFLDGGWFGPNNLGPGGGGALQAAHLTEPQVEITMDDGQTWTPVAHTSDYLTKLTGHLIGGGTVPNPSSVMATFTLDIPVSEITGIRIAGSEGGTASGGFLGVFEFTPHPSTSDTDADGMDDTWERQNGLIVGSKDAAADADSDGLTNLQEFTGKTNPRVADTDGDGLNDGAEVNLHHSDPLRTDTDGDSLSDGAEVNTHHTNPILKDSDGDGFQDGVEIVLGSDPASAASQPVNLAPSGEGILGNSGSLEEGPEVPVFHSGTSAAINDANLTTSVDTFSGEGSFAYVGILFSSPVTKPIVRLDLSIAVFFDGGWFGLNGSGPGTGNTLNDQYLLEPIVQVTTNGGVAWTAVEMTSDYLTVLDGHQLPTVDFGPPTLATAHFQLTTPVSNIDGIRIIGSEGGTAGGGFLGVFDLAVITRTGATLLNPSLQGNQFRFEFDSAAGANHAVQYTTTLSAPNWQPLTTIAGDGTRKQVTDTLTGTPRFYRVTTE